MALVNYVCWQQARAYDVLNTSAENVPDEVFLAIHSEYPLTVLDTNGANYGRPMEAREFLTRFLDPNERHMQVVVQGDSGSGKSHLIKWLSLTIPQTDDQLVLTIPRAGMSLRHIVEKIIAQLPESQQQRYRIKLEQAGDQAGTEDQRRGALLNRIAEAIKSDSRVNANISEEEAWLLDGLPHVFLDPQLRTVLDRREGVIGQLVEHIFDDSQHYQRWENQRLFGPDDLPGLEDVEHMAKPTQDILKYMAPLPALVPVALDIINRNVGRAIASVLNLSGDQLVNIMTELRKFLHSRGQSLTLLIEDFARLQGVDGEMLQALSQEGSDENGLCSLRWAMAVTTGYYKRVQETVQTRMNYLVDMNLPTSGTEAVIGEDQIVAFASRYLNAVRLPLDRLRKWKVSRRGDQVGAPVPNACQGCLHIDTCHATFGHQNGVGLYPFTRSAILNMAHRRDTRLHERFNPRILVKHVLKEVLGTHADDLASGEFPSTTLLKTMGGTKLPLGTVDRLSRSNPHFERHLAVLELYSSNMEAPGKLPDAIYHAFSVPPAPDLGEELVPSPTDTKTNIKPPPPPPLPGPLERRIEAVRAWGRGDFLPEQPAQRLRDLIFASLEDYVDWDALGLHRVDLVRLDNGVFRPRHIHFRDQATIPQIPSDAIDLPIPLVEKSESERRKAALAIEGLLRFTELGHWNFTDGALMLAALGECLERWSTHLVEQIRRYPDGEGAWNHIASTVEVLAVGAALAGRPAKEGASLADHLNALLEPWPAPTDDEALSAPWSKLYAELYAAQPHLKALLKTWAYGTKGGEAKNFTDPSKLVPALERIRQNWTPATVPPKAKLARRVDGLGKVGTAYARIQIELGAAAVAEWQRRTAWLDQIRQQVPEGTTWQETLAALRETLQAVTTHGLPCRDDVTHRFREALSVVEHVNVDETIAGLEPLRQEANPVGILPKLGSRTNGAVIAVTGNFLKVVDEFLREVEAKVNSEAAAAGTESNEMQRDVVRLERGLEELGDALFALGGNHA